MKHSHPAADTLASFVSPAGCGLDAQIVMEGFLRISLPPWQRRLLTRFVAMVPAVIVAGTQGNMGAGKLLVLSQVRFTARTVSKYHDAQCQDCMHTVHVVPCHIRPSLNVAHALRNSGFALHSTIVGTSDFQVIISLTLFFA